MKKTLTAAMFSIVLATGATGAAYAQDAASPNASDSTSTQQPGEIANMTMAGFFADKEMKTMKTPDEMKAFWMAMSDADKKKMSETCTTPEEQMKGVCDFITTQK